MKKPAFNPAHDQVIVEPLQTEAKSVGGLHLAPSAAPDDLKRGRVLMVGPGRVGPNGDRLPVWSAPDSVVVYREANARSIYLDGATYHLLSDNAVLGSLGD